jgi:tetratricopeptide (TPR) repeat protein
MTGYRAREVAEMLGLTVGQVRSWARAGFVAPVRGARGEMRFSFQDLVLLRTAAHLVRARIAPRRVKRALSALRAQLPAGRPLTGVHVRADGDRIVVGDGGASFEPESGQVVLDFGVAEMAREVAALPDRRRAEGERALGAADWYEWACNLEEAAPAEAMLAYQRALELDPAHGEARVNLGRLLHEAGRPLQAADHYSRALEAHPDDVTAAFNLGVALDDLGRRRDAASAYLRAVQIDPGCADAHWNLAQLYERSGDRARALRHLRAYRALMPHRPGR